MVVVKILRTGGARRYTTPHTNTHSPTYKHYLIIPAIRLRANVDYGNDDDDPRGACPFPRPIRLLRWRTARPKQIKENRNQSRIDLTRRSPRVRHCKRVRCYPPPRRLLKKKSKQRFARIFSFSQRLRDAGFPPNVLQSAVDGILSLNFPPRAMYSDKVEVLRFETEPYRNKNGSPNKSGLLHYNNNTISNNKNHNSPKNFIYQNGYHSTSV